jgi:hypothetical protein
MFVHNGPQPSYSIVAEWKKKLKEDSKKSGHKGRWKYGQILNFRANLPSQEICIKTKFLICHINFNYASIIFDDESWPIS